MHWRLPYFLLVWLLISCQTNYDFSYRQKNWRPITEALPRALLLRPFEEQAAAQNAARRVTSPSWEKTYRPLMQRERLLATADSLFLQLLHPDSVRRYGLMSGLKSVWSEMPGQPVPDKQLLAMATDVEHDSLLKQCHDRWQGYFSTLEQALRQVYARQWRAGMRPDSVAKKITHQDIKLIITAETERFWKRWRNGYVYRCLVWDHSRQACAELDRPGLIYYSRIWLKALAKSWDPANGTGGA
ncbi:MAG: hypothetical protein D6677_09305 [Calditrichaeota bacterium]|nr:MAG: hypothetical protein D6677_09305 [Calditrichota bacterium]